MSNNAHVNDDEIEIHKLPEVSTLQAGMMVAVDSQPTGTKSFNLTNALAGKLSEPASAPQSGQILSFDGSANAWATPPEGVYVLNCSKVNNLTDIDLNRAKTQPTYIRIDEGYGDVSISVPYRDGDNPSTYNIVLKVGTLLRLSSIPAGDSEFIFTTVYNAAFYAGSMGSYGAFFPVLYIRSNDGYLYKTFNVSGEFSTGSLQMGIPTAFTKFYRTSRGNGSAASDRNSLEVQFQWNGNIRKQCLLPGEVSTHNFANDSTTEQIQFMGWGATSNRAGYKTINEVPTSAAGDSGKVLTVAANGTPGWGNAVGFVKNAGALTDAATITASNLNNGFATLSTSQSALTIVDVVGTDEIVNFAIEITPSVNCTLTIKKKVGSNEAVTLKHSVAAGNALEANKTYQVTAVGTCWTLAEFES